MRRPFQWLVAAVMVMMVALGATLAWSPASAQEGQIDPTCSDDLDNDGDTLVDGEDPSCVVLSEEPPVTPAPTAEPTAEPTAVPTAEPTAAPPPEPTPADFPPTGGSPHDPGDGGSVFEDVDTGTGGDANATDVLAGSGVAGLAVSLAIMGLTYLKLLNNATAKRVAVGVLAVGAGLVLAASQDGVRVENEQDVIALIAATFTSAQISYVFFAGKIQSRTEAPKE